MSARATEPSDVDQLLSYCLKRSNDEHMPSELRACLALANGIPAAIQNLMSKHEMENLVKLVAETIDAAVALAETQSKERSDG